MSCRICKRSSCTESFHSIEEQEQFEKKSIIRTEELFYQRTEALEQIANALGFVKISGAALEEIPKQAFKVMEALQKIASDENLTDCWAKDIAREVLDESFWRG